MHSFIVSLLRWRFLTGAAAMQQRFDKQGAVLFVSCAYTNKKKKKK